MLQELGIRYFPQVFSVNIFLHFCANADKTSTSKMWHNGFMYRKKNTMCKLRHMNRQSVTPNQPHAFRRFPCSLIAKILTHTIVHNPAIHMEQWDTYKNHRTHIHTLAKTLRHWNVLLRPQACVFKLPACWSEFPHVLKSKVMGVQFCHPTTWSRCSSWSKDNGDPSSWK